MSNSYWCGSIKRQFQRLHRRGGILGASRSFIKELIVTCGNWDLGKLIYDYPAHSFDLDYGIMLDSLGS